jgi:hypothetical protein
LVLGNNFDDFMSELKEAPGVIAAHREAATLWVKVAGPPDFKERAQELAEKIADWYKAKVGGIICVRVYYGNRHTIGKACRH